MNSEILKKYNTLLTESSFIPIPNCEQFSPAGSSWQLSPELGGGHYWLYARKDLFDIKIHDFHFQNDFVLNFDIPEGISITRYDSISGEELNPYRRLSAGSIQTIVGGKQNYSGPCAGHADACGHMDVCDEPKQFEQFRNHLVHRRCNL